MKILCQFKKMWIIFLNGHCEYWHHYGLRKKGKYFFQNIVGEKIVFKQNKKETVMKNITQMKNNLTGAAGIRIDAPVSKVWEALTTPSIIKQYFFNTVAVSDWKEGSPLIFKGEWRGKQYEDKGIILNVDLQKLFRYTYWSSMSGLEDKPENYVTITYELTERNNGTYLSVKQENIRDEKTRQHSEENWNKVLAELKEFLERQPVTKGSVFIY
jgi:uncharacterized protein YndB with AHSA1/START domain